MGEALVAGLLAGYGVAVPVGAIAALIVGLTARTSLKVGAAAALGAATADGVYALVAVLGGAALARLIEPVATPLRWAAATILVGLAARTGITAVRAHRDARRDAHRDAGSAAAPARPAAAPSAGLGTPGRAYLGLLGLTLGNPATVVYFGALVLGRQSGEGLTAAGEAALVAAVFVAAAFVASASWQLLLAGGGAVVGAVVGRVLTGGRGRLATALVASMVIVVLAGALVVPAG